VPFCRLTKQTEATEVAPNWTALRQRCPQRLHELATREGSVLRGKCSRGRVTIKTETQPEHLPEPCHYTLCRKRSAHVLSAFNIRRDARRIGGEAFVSRHRDSENVERGFCS
jgi:hypothetical protein